MQNDLSPEEIAMMNAQAEVQVEIDQAKMQRQIEALTAKLQKTERTADTARIAELEAENFRLAAGACINPGEHGLVGDEHGNSYCTAFRALTDEQREHSEALALVNERDARIAELEGELRFLLDRLAEFESGSGAASVGDWDGMWSEFHAHVAPSASRLRTALGGQP